MEISVEQAVDVGYSVFSAHKKDDLQQTFEYPDYSPLNELFGAEKSILEGGDSIKGWITLGDEGNAKHISLWEEDSENVVNIDKEIKVDWTHVTTNVSYNRIELGMTMNDKLRTFRYLDGKKKNMFRELAQLLYLAMFSAPTSSGDKKNPHGLPCWLSWGADNTYGGFVGYSGHYNDGSATEYNVGGIASSSSSNARWASYYYDHNGNLGDNLISALDDCTISCNFVPPVVPQTVAEKSDVTHNRMRYLTTKKIIKNLNALLRKSDDRFGSDLGKYAGLLNYKGVPFIYAKPLDTADSDTYKTDPLFAVNFDYFKAYVLASNNFVIGKPTPRDSQHNILRVPVDLSYCFFSPNRQRLGFLINEQ